MAENEAKETKEFNARKWIIWTIIISVIIVIGAAIFLIVTYFKDDSNRSLIEYIEQGIVILLAVAGGCSSIISMINGKKNNEEQQRREDALRNEQRVREDKLLKQQKEFEEKWNQKKIDADLKARARIEWIQDVRKATSRFITACYCILKIDNYNREEMKEIFPDIQETGLLLILYFGPDKSGENDKVTKEINKILKKIEKFIIGDYKSKIFDEIDDLSKEIDQCFDDESLDPEIQEDECFSISCRQGILIDEYEHFKNETIHDLKSFSWIIRQYLKTEWDRAKNNED